MKILILASHPDDAEISCGGTIAKHIAKGDKVKIVYVTSGEKGGDPRIREQESKKAAKILGVNDLEFWHFKDNELELEDERLKSKILIMIAKNYDLLYSPSYNESHKDHRRLALCIKDLWERYLLKRFSFYEVFPGLPIIKAENCVDITPYIDLKIKALKCFKSQKLNLAEAYRCLARFRGIFTGVGEYVEAFMPYE